MNYHLDPSDVANAAPLSHAAEQIGSVSSRKNAKDNVGPEVFALYVTFSTGYIQVLTFSSAFLRGLEMIALSSQPVTLRIANY